MELIADMLSTQLNNDLRIAALTRRVERAGIEAETDALTGLWNRRGWDRLFAMEEERCQKYGHPACVLVLDLDGLKGVNDASGHGAGDDLLRRVAQILKRNVRESDVLARVGGDEFGILLIESRRTFCEGTGHSHPAAVGCGRSTRFDRNGNSKPNLPT